MSKDVRYWDACAFLGFLNGEQDKVSECQAVLKAAHNGHVLIVTSALSLAEVIWIKGGPKLDATKRTIVEQFFKADYISVRNVTRIVAEVAQSVVWDYGIKPKDAIHVATAAVYKLPMLNTYDEELLDKNGTTINGHVLAIQKPHYVEQLDLEVTQTQDQHDQAQEPSG